MKKLILPIFLIMAGILTGYSTLEYLIGFSGYSIRGSGNVYQFYQLYKILFPIVSLVYGVFLLVQFKKYGLWQMIIGLITVTIGSFLYFFFYSFSMYYLTTSF